MERQPLLSASLCCCGLGLCGRWGCAGAALGALGVHQDRGREGEDSPSHEGERLPWLTPRFPDDKQLRERDLQQIKSEGKVHYLPRGAPARRPVAGGRAFWLVEPILIVPGGSALLPGLQGGTGGMELGPGWEGTHQGLGFLSHWHLRGHAGARPCSCPAPVPPGAAHVSLWPLEAPGICPSLCCGGAGYLQECPKSGTGGTEQERGTGVTAVRFLALQSR